MRGSSALPAFDAEQAAAAEVDELLLVEDLDLEAEALAEGDRGLAHPRGGEVSGGRVREVPRDVRGARWSRRSATPRSASCSEPAAATRSIDTSGASVSVLLSSV